MIPTFDTDGTIIPGAELDEMLELGFDDPDYGDPEGWPERWDEAIWELGPDPLAEAWEPYTPSAADLEDYRNWCREIDARWDSIRMGDDPGYVTDRDIVTLQGGCG